MSCRAPQRRRDPMRKEEGDFEQQLATCKTFMTVRAVLHQNTLLIKTLSSDKVWWSPYEAINHQVPVTMSEVKQWSCCDIKAIKFCCTLYRLRWNHVTPNGSKYQLEKYWEEELSVKPSIINTNWRKTTLLLWRRRKRQQTFQDYLRPGHTHTHTSHL